MLSSLGFHTLTLSLLLQREQTIKLRSDFIEYSKRTKSIKIYPDNGCTKIIFHNGDRGISWCIKPRGHFEDYQDYIYVKVNPKLLSGKIDYLNAATLSDMKAAIYNFDMISKEISPLLRSFHCYEYNRVDYCVNFCIRELVAGCDAGQIMTLIKRSNIPDGFEEHKEYDGTSHRMKSYSNSFYLESQSVTINCYLKNDELLERKNDHRISPYSSITQETLGKAKHIIRFEVQCKQRKIHKMLESAKEKGYHMNYDYEYLLSPAVCEDIILYYFCETIGTGDWYTFSSAVKKIESCEFNAQKQERLIVALDTVHRHRSVPNAKESCSDEELASLNRSLKDLIGLGINPVTIPQSMIAEWVGNLLRSYYCLLSQEGKWQDELEWTLKNDKKFARK